MSKEKIDGYDIEILAVLKHRLEKGYLSDFNTIKHEVIVGIGFLEEKKLTDKLENLRLLNYAKSYKDIINKKEYWTITESGLDFVKRG